jgi:hypothetical protein
MDAVAKDKTIVDFRDNLIDMTTDHQIQVILKETSVSKLWWEVSNNCPSLGQSAVTALLPIG